MQLLKGNSGNIILIDKNGKILTSNLDNSNVINVETFIDFHAATLDVNLPTDYQGSVYGNSDRWNWGPGGIGDVNPDLWQVVTGPDIPFFTPIKTPDGQIHSSTGTKWLRGDLTIFTGGFRYIRYTFPISTLCEATAYFFFSPSLNNTGTDNSRDFFAFNDNPYAVAQIVFPFGSPTPAHGGMHATNGGFPSQVGNVPLDKKIKMTLVQDNQTAVSFVKYEDAETGELIFSSISYGDQFSTEQNFSVQEGYIALEGLDGYVYKTAVSLDTQTVNKTGRSPWTPKTPSNASISQTGDGQITINFTDNTDELNPHTVDVWDGTSWTNAVASVGASHSTLDLTGLTAGLTYKIRIYSTFPPDSSESSKVESNSITIIASNWNYSVDPATTDTNVDQNVTYLNYPVPVVISSSGTCTKIRVKFDTIAGSTQFKIAIFDSSGNLINNWSTFTGTSTGLIEFSVPSPFSVTAQTYYVGLAANCNSSTVIYSSKSAISMTYYFSNGDWAGFPSSTMSAGGSAGASAVISVGMLIQ